MLLVEFEQVYFIFKLLYPLIQQLLILCLLPCLFLLQLFLLFLVFEEQAIMLLLDLPYFGQ